MIFKENISLVNSINWLNFFVLLSLLCEIFFLFSFRVFFHGHWRLTGTPGESHFLFHSTTSTRSRTFRHLFTTLHVRWLLHIFHRTACNYQTATCWGLPPYRFTIGLIDDMMLIFVSLLDDLILGSHYRIFNTGNLRARTLIDYHLCIISGLTSQVC